MAKETKVVAYRLPDGTYYPLGRLPLDLVLTIEKDHATSWILVCDMPQTNAGVLVDVIRAVAAVNDITPPRLDTVDDLARACDDLALIDTTTGLPVAVARRDDEPISWTPIS